MKAQWRWDDIGYVQLLNIETWILLPVIKQPPMHSVGNGLTSFINYRMIYANPWRKQMAGLSLLKTNGNAQKEKAEEEERG